MADPSTFQAVWSAYDWFQVIGIGAVAGAIGQGIRTVIGLKKVSDTASATSTPASDLIDPSRLVVSLIIGAIAGAIAAASLIKSLTAISSEQFFALVASGYAGADFIEGFMNREIPQTGSGSSAQPPSDNAVG